MIARSFWSSLKRATVSQYSLIDSSAERDAGQAAAAARKLLTARSGLCRLRNLRPSLNSTQPVSIRSVRI
ncbi:MAG: hypothetical protein ACLQMF_08335 [Rectinemataceae bacterium]